ncbi:MAG TPA: metallophosphoesterase [Vicinamibacterales bacterium]|nr:metallophosphoesterase [Vicinamibacterales bacterium]
MGECVPQYRELYSISDLHLGGTSPKNQIFCHGQRLKAFVESLAAKPGPLALVIAGDLFDSLPYLTGTGAYIAVDSAVDIIDKVMTDASFAPVFEGLRSFIGEDGHELVILIGNHDLEIALPEPQERLLAQIAPTSAARGRVRFSTSGGGFRCRVGSSTVYITHGNEADPWNHVDHEALRRVAHARTAGQAFNAREWVPNAGTKLVIDVMNTIKETHPFIDLLKPETRAAVRTLSVLAPKTLWALFDALPAFADAARAHAGPHVVLGPGGQVVADTPPVVRLLGDASRAVAQSGVAQTAALHERVTQLQQSGKRPADLVSDEGGTLGYPRAWWDWVSGRDPADALRDALRDWVSDDESFNLKDPDSTCRGILSQVGPGVDVVITGHTHLPRWIAAQDRDLVYLNAGAWARVIGLRHEFLENADAFRPVHEALKASDLNVLDTTRVTVAGVDLPLVLDATAAAHVVERKNGALAELVRVTRRNDVVQEEPVDRGKSVLEWR